MRTQSPDTSPEAELVQIELIRRSSMARRFEIVRSLSAFTRQLALNGIRRANPSASEEEIKYIFLKVHYGEELAQAVTNYLAARQKAREEAEMPDDPGSG
jgi:hypothetical protein